MPLSSSAAETTATDERDSQSRTPLTVDRVATEGTTMSTPDASKAADLAEGVDAGGPGPSAVGEQEESAGRGEEAIADGGHRRSHESPKEERQEEMKGSHTASLEAPPAPEVREKIVERVVVEEKVCTHSVAWRRFVFTTTEEAITLHIRVEYRSENFPRGSVGIRVSGYVHTSTRRIYDKIRVECIIAPPPT